MLIDEDDYTEPTLKVERGHDAAQRITEMGHLTEYKRIALDGIEMNREVISSLTRLLQSKDKYSLTLQLQNCVWGANVKESELRKFMDSLSHVKRLTFYSGVRNMKETNRYLFFPIGKSLRVTNLRLFTSNFDRIQGEKLGECLTTSTVLRELTLTSSSRSWYDLVPILSTAFCKNRSIERLHLRKTGLSDECTTKFVKALIGHPKLRELELSYNTMPDETLKDLNNLLQHENCQLQDLRLSAESRLDDRSLKISLLAPALTLHSTGLKRLSLRNWELAQDELLSVIDALTCNRQLEHFLISCDCQLSDNFLIYLGERLPKMKLKQLRISGKDERCDSPAAMTALLDGLRQNTTLQDFDIHTYGNWNQRIMQENYLNLNRGGRRALVENIPLTLWPLVFERVQKNKKVNAKANVMYYLLRNEPALWLDRAMAGPAEKSRGRRQWWRQRGKARRPTRVLPKLASLTDRLTRVSVGLNDSKVSILREQDYITDFVKHWQLVEQDGKRKYRFIGYKT